MIRRVTPVNASGRDKAHQTRRRILLAAHAEFIEHGYDGATIAGIARRAEVAAQTVYFVFHTKAQLISAAIDAAVLGEAPLAPQQSEWWAAMESCPSAVDALRIFIRGAGPVFARAARIAEVMRAAALADDEVAATRQRHDELQRTGFAQVVDIISAKGPLRPGLDPDKATDILLTLYGDNTYIQMTIVHAWSHDQYIEWMCDAAPRLLLDLGEQLPHD